MNTEEIDENIAAFEEWIQALEDGKKNFYTSFDIRKLVTEAGSRFGTEHREKLKMGCEETIDLVYNSWFGKSEEVTFLDRDEMCLRLRDMMEAEMNPIADCDQCSAAGNVCFENDEGLSHRVSIGKTTLEDMLKLNKPAYYIKAATQRSASLEQ